MVLKKLLYLKYSTGKVKCCMTVRGWRGREREDNAAYFAVGHFLCTSKRSQLLPWLAKQVLEQHDCEVLSDKFCRRGQCQRGRKSEMPTCMQGLEVSRHHPESEVQHEPSLHSLSTSQFIPTISASSCRMTPFTQA